jgi:hypothetical protein
MGEYVMKKIIRLLDTILFSGLIAILVLTSLAFTVAFSTRWKWQLFGLELNGIPAALCVLAYAMGAVVILFILVRYPHHRIAGVLFSAAFFCVLFIDISVSLRKNTAGHESFSNLLATVLLIPIMYLAIHVLIRELEKQPGENSSNVNPAGSGSKKIIALASGSFVLLSIVLVLLVTGYPPTESLFEVTNQDTAKAHTVHILVTDEVTRQQVYEGTILLSPGQWTEHRIAPLDSRRDFNFTITRDGTETSHFILELGNGWRGIIDIADPDAHSGINPCIFLGDWSMQGSVDTGNPKPIYTVINSDADLTHIITVSVTDAAGTILSENQFTLAPGQEIRSPVWSAISEKRYIVTTTDERNLTSGCDMRIGPHTANCRMIIQGTGIEVVDSQGIRVDYAARYWTGKCSG